MFSFLNTVEVLPVDRVNFIAETLAAAGLDAAVLLKAKTGLPGSISLNVWVASCDPFSQSIPTEIVCCAGSQDKLKNLLEQMVREIQAAAAAHPDPRRAAAPVPITLSTERPG